MGGAHHEAGAGEMGGGPRATGNVPEWVAAEAINYLKDRVNGHGGMILLDAQGRFGIAHNTPRMAWALKTSKQESYGIERER